MQNNFSRLKKLIISAIFLALAIIVGQCKIVIPGLFRIVFNGPFYKFIAIIFGPLYGMIVSFLIEFIGILLNNQGGYKFLFLITAIIRGFLIALIWQLLNKRFDDHKKNRTKLIISIGVTDYLISFLNTLILKYSLIWPIETFWTNLFLRLIKDTIMIILNIFILNIMLGVYEEIVKINVV